MRKAEPFDRLGGTCHFVAIPTRSVLPLIALSALGVACNATISDTAGVGGSAAASPTAGASGNGATGGTSAAGGTSGSGGSSGKSGGSGGSATAVAGVTPVTRVARLTHTQYQNTVNDLFGIEDDSSSAFAPDALDGFDFDTSIDFRVDARLGPQYRAAAETLAQRAVTDAAVFKRLVTCDTTAASCSKDFITSFGQRAFRRPLTSAETDRFASLFAEGADLVGSGDAFKDGVSLVVEAVLQSPQFLYRTELGTQTGSDGLIALDGWEMASRLSYFVWNTLPDDQLFASAKGNALASDADVQAAIARLIADARATSVAVSFHDQAWAFGRFARISPDAKTYPKAPSDIAVRATDAAHAFVGDVFESDGGLHELLTAPYAFADSGLAPLYGKSVSGSGMQRIDFEPTERKGILMQVGYLASNAYSIKTDPIHRGLFVLRNLLCANIPNPPAGAAQTPAPATDNPPKTTRGEVELLTGQSQCKGCHDSINPPGFAFEGFDAVGQIRKDEDGEALDTTGS
ncbi:MAG TPA: DUF1592 domain-containing protein, partial [Polyangiaceae bacterium]|nr:DUF1592 domain-containing protein [Polyangiaceae bacterium]